MTNLFCLSTIVFFSACLFGAPWYWLMAVGVVVCVGLWGVCRGENNMLKFISVNEKLPKNGNNFIYVVKCSDWCGTGYQVCYFRHGKFEYDEQSNDNFNECVTEWAVLADIFD